MRLLAAFLTGLTLTSAAAVPRPGLSTENDASLPKRGLGAREKLSNIVDQILESMVAHDPSPLPLAPSYYATENSHPTALGFMTLWRTTTKAGKPDLLAIDITQGSAYFALPISEGTDATQSVLWARIKVVNDQITELELYVNRSRGDHGFSLSPEELPQNFAKWSSLPADRLKATRAELESLSAATFNTNSTFNVTVADDCQFTEEGWHVVDPGPDRNGSYTPLSCVWPDSRPTDPNARTNLVIDEESGIVVTGAIVHGVVYPYGNISAFIPDSIAAAQEAQDAWLAAAKQRGDVGLLVPTKATGETLQVLQYYDGKLQGEQINVYLSGPGMTSAWL